MTSDESHCIQLTGTHLWYPTGIPHQTLVVVDDFYLSNIWRCLSAAIKVAV